MYVRTYVRMYVCMYVWMMMMMIYIYIYIYVYIYDIYLYIWWYIYIVTWYNGLIGSLWIDHPWIWPCGWPAKTDHGKSDPWKGLWQLWLRNPIRYIHGESLKYTGAGHGILIHFDHDYHRIGWFWTKFNQKPLHFDGKNHGFRWRFSQQNQSMDLMFNIWYLPSGKRLHNELERSTIFFMEKLTISTGPFSIENSLSIFIG